MVSAITLALILATGAALSVRAQTRPVLEYYVAAYPIPPARQPVKLCIGESVRIEVWVIRYFTPPGRPEIHSRVSNARVFGFINEPQSVGHFDPSDAGRETVGQPSVAKFQFVADDIGKTTIDFQVVRTGDEATYGSGWPQSSDVIDVEVTDCYEAYTSGLGTTFDGDGNNMGGFNRPFLLSGVLDQGGITGKSHVMFFIPGQQERPPSTCPVYACRGVMMFIETWKVGPADCSAYVSGRYEVVFHPHSEGDVKIYGSGQYFCGGGGAPIDYEHSVGFMIAFKPRPPGP